jgi:hypothetical protein
MMVPCLRPEFAQPDLPCALCARQPWGVPAVEPPLGELLADPVVQAVMRRDGVTRAALESCVADARGRLRQG